MNRLQLLFLFLLPISLSAQSVPALQINEIMQSNVDQLYVGHNFPDSWVELYNTTGKAINLKNWYLGTQNDLSQAFQFVHFNSIDPHSYGVIYCDKKNDGWQHTDFRLESTSKGTIYIWNDKGQLVDSLAYPKMPAPNVAYGLCSDGSWIHELQATPGNANVEVPGYVLPLPDFSHEGCLLHDGDVLTLKIQVPDPDQLPSDTRLLVTLDGSMPNADASLSYDIHQGAELLVDHTTVVRARLLSAQALASLPVTHSFIFHPRQTRLPILSLSTDAGYLYSDDEGILVGSDFGSNLYKDWARPLNIEYFEQDSAQATINQMGEAKSHGLGSQLYSQKSINLIAHKRFGKKKFNAGTFWPDKPEINKIKTFCIRNGGNRCIDTRFEDAFAQLLFGRHVDSLQYLAYRPVIAYVNGEYKGVYGLRERSHKSWVENNLGIDEDSVAIVESFYTTSPLYDEVLPLIDDSCATYQDFARVLDLPLFVKYLCAEAYATNNDYPHNNVWMWRDFTNPDDPFHPLLKDLDYCSTNVRTNWFNLMLCRKPESGAVVNAERHKLIIRLLELPEFRQSFLDHMQTYLGDFCKPSVTVPMVQQMRDEIADEVAPTFAIMTEGVSYEQDFIGQIEGRLLPYCRELPMHLFNCMASTFELGSVIPMQIVTPTNDEEGDEPLLPITLNDIPLTEGNYDGACFTDRSFMLDAGHPDYGWLLTAEFADGYSQTERFLDPVVTFLAGSKYAQAKRLTFTPRTQSELSIQPIHTDRPKPTRYFDLLGRPIAPGTTHTQILRLTLTNPAGCQ